MMISPACQRGIARLARSTLLVCVLAGGLAFGGYESAGQGGSTASIGEGIGTVVGFLGGLGLGVAVVGVASRYRASEPIISGVLASAIFTVPAAFFAGEGNVLHRTALALTLSALADVVVIAGAALAFVVSRQRGKHL